MYSPKISEDLVRALYLIAKQKHIPMTTLVNEILRDALSYSHDRSAITDSMVAEKTSSASYPNPSRKE